MLNGGVACWTCGEESAPPVVAAIRQMASIDRIFIALLVRPNWLLLDRQRTQAHRIDQTHFPYRPEYLIAAKKQLPFVQGARRTRGLTCALRKIIETKSVGHLNGWMILINVPGDAWTYG